MLVPLHLIQDKRFHAFPITIRYIIPLFLTVDLNVLQLLSCRFLHPDAEKAFTDLTSILNENPLLLRKLNLSEHKLDTKLKQLAPLLADKHCKINTLT